MPYINTETGEIVRSGQLQGGAAGQPIRWVDPQPPDPFREYTGSTPEDFSKRMGEVVQWMGNNGYIPPEVMSRIDTNNVTATTLNKLSPFLPDEVDQLTRNWYASNAPDYSDGGLFNNIRDFFSGESHSFAGVSPGELAASAMLAGTLGGLMPGTAGADPMFAGSMAPAATVAPSVGITQPSGAVAYPVATPDPVTGIPLPEAVAGGVAGGTAASVLASPVDMGTPLPEPSPITDTSVFSDMSDDALFNPTGATIPATPPAPIMPVNMPAADPSVTLPGNIPVTGGIDTTDVLAGAALTGGGGTSDVTSDVINALAGGGVSPGTFDWLNFGTNLLNAGLAYDTSEKMADAMRHATEQSIGLQRDMFDYAKEQQAPFQQAGVDSLNRLTGAIEQPFDVYDPYQGPGMYDPYQQPADYAGFDPTAMYGEFQPNDLYDPYQTPGDFEFNMEADPGYQFALQEAEKAALRQAARTGSRNSGNIMAELSDRAAGIASQYAPQIFNRQLMTSRENYGRNMDAFDLDRMRNLDEYNRMRDVYGLGADRSNTMFNRGVTGYGLDVNREQDLYSRGLDTYGLERQRYGDLVDQSARGFEAGRQRNQDQYGRQQDYLNRLASIAQIGQTSATNLGNTGMTTAANMGNIYGQNAIAQGQARDLRNQGFMGAINQGTQNYLFNRYFR